LRTASASSGSIFSTAAQSLHPGLLIVILPTVSVTFWRVKSEPG
jgi:hypothetical protein